MTTRFASSTDYTSFKSNDIRCFEQEKRSAVSSRSSSVDSHFHKELLNSKNERSDSYSSVKEDRDGLPQSFIVAKRRSPSEVEALHDDDDEQQGESAVVEDLSASTGSLLSFPPPTEKSLGALPQEVLENIVERLVLDVPATDYTPRNRDLMSCLLASRSLCGATIRVLYRQVTFPHSHTFSKFMGRLRAEPDLGRLVRRLDLSHFSSLGMGRTKQLNKEIQNLTSRSLVECLNAIPKVREVLLQEHVDQDIDTYVLLKLFFGLPDLRALDICASSTANFAESFSHATSRLLASPTLTIRLERLCLHECFTLSSSSLALLISRSPNLTVLDLHHTRVTDAALESLPPTARLTHLNLGRCPSLTAPGVLNFLRTHPAARSLVWLNLSCDISRWRLFDEHDVAALLPLLPASLRSLNLNGAKVRHTHVPALLRLTRHLEELGLAYTDLSLNDVERLFGPPSSSRAAGPCLTSYYDSTWTLEDQHAAEEEEEENDADPAYDQPCALHYLDLTGLPSATQAGLHARADLLLGGTSSPLEVIEVGSKVATALGKTQRTNKSLGWTVKELGRRSWYVRQPAAGNGVERSYEECGGRDWKMGSCWWGMRKAPVAWSEVGGLYGHYMFKTRVEMG